MLKDWLIDYFQIIIPQNTIFGVTQILHNTCKLMSSDTLENMQSTWGHFENNSLCKIWGQTEWIIGDKK